LSVFLSQVMVDARAEGFRRYASWASSRSVEDEPSQAIAGIGFVWSLLPEDARRADPDPEKLGVRRMHQALAKVFEGVR
jgi:hypothetical protein